MHRRIEPQLVMRIELCKDHYRVAVHKSFCPHGSWKYELLTLVNRLLSWW